MFEPWREGRDSDAVPADFGCSSFRYDSSNTLLRGLIPMAEIDRRLAGIDPFSATTGLEVSM
jgi:hypothetical protein